MKFTIDVIKFYTIRPKMILYRWDRNVMEFRRILLVIRLNKLKSHYVGKNSIYIILYIDV